jgi:hypothetical protein
MHNALRGLMKPTLSRRNQFLKTDGSLNRAVFDLIFRNQKLNFLKIHYLLLSINYILFIAHVTIYFFPYE